MSGEARVEARPSREEVTTFDIERFMRAGLTIEHGVTDGERTERIVGFAETADAILAIFSPPPASGGEGELERWPSEAMIEEGLKVDFDNEDERATVINVWNAMEAARLAAPQPQTEGEAAS